jgi:hypothetical protein
MKIKVYVVSREEEPKGNTVAPSSDGNVFAVTLRFMAMHEMGVTGGGDVKFWVYKADYERFVPGTEREFELR